MNQYCPLSHKSNRRDMQNYFLFCSGSFQPPQYLNLHMLADKRNKIRKQVRSQELNRRFAFQRKELLEGRHSIFRELYDQMKSGELQGKSSQLSQRIMQCAQHYLDEENSYILIGNFLIEYPQEYYCFEYFLIKSARFLQNYLWCINLLALSYLNHGERIDKIGNKMVQVILIVSQMGLWMKSNNSTRQHMQKIIRMQAEYVLTVKFILHSKCIIPQLFQPIKYCLQIISSLQNHECQSQDLSFCFDFFLVLKQEWSLVQQHQLELYFANAFAKIALGCLKCVPHFRQECVAMIQFLMHDQKKTPLVVYLPIKELISELLYIKSEVPALSQPILKVFKLFVQQMNINELSYLLQQRVHIALTEGMEQAMQNHNNSQLQCCLAGLYHTLNKLNTLQEEKLLMKVKMDIENINFHLMIEGLLNNDQNEVISTLVNNIVDDFYSQDVDEGTL